MFVLLAVALAGLMTGCQRKSLPEPAEETSQRTVPRVTVVHPERHTVLRRIERPGYNVEAYQSTPLYAKVPGYVLEWNVDIGATVKKNQILAVLDVPEMEVELQERKAAVDQAVAEVQQANAAVRRARAEERHTQSQYERLERLAKTGQGGVIDKENVAEARFLFEAAQAGVDKAVADVSVAEQRAEVARKRRDYTATLLKYARIRAPFDGIVTQRNVNVGDLVQPPNGQKGEAMFVVDQVNPVRVVVNVPEAEAVWVRDGQEASIRGQGPREQKFKGTVARTARALHPVNRTLRTEIQLGNPGEKLMPGMYVDVTLDVKHRNAWTLPASAVLTKEEQSFCYLLEGSKAVRTPLQVGLRGVLEREGGEKVQVVEILKKQTKAARPGEKEVWEDLTEEDKVIKDGVTELEDGQQVRTASAKPSR
jgi:RND family efflux transporter MFP subunit